MTYNIITITIITIIIVCTKWIIGSVPLQKYCKQIIIQKKKKKTTPQHFKLKLPEPVEPATLQHALVPTALHNHCAIVFVPRDEDNILDEIYIEQMCSEFYYEGLNF